MFFTSVCRRGVPLAPSQSMAGREGEFYYLFATGGGAWVSRDFVNWRFQAATPISTRHVRTPFFVAVHRATGETVTTPVAASFSASAAVSFQLPSKRP